jgi:CMP/dCMP kinase
MSRSLPVVAIDGPAGAGKSTVTRGVADALSYLVLDTGALYRSVALAAQRAGVAFTNDVAVAAVAADLAARGAIEFRSGNGAAQSVWLCGSDVSLAIRSQEMSDGASRISSIPAVRSALLEIQRKVGEHGGVVVEGRDIGSVVFPDAEAKFFLTASVEVRAKRRLQELLQRGEAANYDDVAREVRERDGRDRNRAIAPLVQAADAILVDSSQLSIEQAVGAIVDHVKAVVRRLKMGTSNLP